MEDNSLRGASGELDASREYTVAVVHAGTSEGASTSLLVERLAQSLRKRFAADGVEPVIETIALKGLSEEIGSAIVTGYLGERLQSAQQTLLRADALIAATPVYKAEASGLFSSFFHVIDRDLLIGKPVLLGATAGTPRHSLVLDHQIRSLFAYMRALVAPTSVFAAPEDWNDSKLDRRIDRAAHELKVLTAINFPESLKNDTFDAYQRDFGGAGGSHSEINFDTDLMKLATGGSAS